MLPLDDRELVHRQPVVRLGIVEIDQPHMIARDAAVIAPVLDLHAVAQHPVKGAVVANERRRIMPQHFAQRLFPRVAGNRGIQSGDRIIGASNRMISSLENSR